MKKMGIYSISSSTLSDNSVTDNLTSGNVLADEKLNEPSLVKTLTKTREKHARAAKSKETATRRAVAKRWNMMAQSIRYKEAALEDSCTKATLLIEDELFDGILLNLNERSSAKSYACQKRLLRRIVEKWQAQSTFKIVGRTTNRYGRHQVRRCASKSMQDIKKYQWCV